MENTNDNAYKELLLTYNSEDCRALKLLVEELTKIQFNSKSLPDVDFADKPKQNSTDLGQTIHNDLKTILILGYADYDTKKISLQNSKDPFEITEPKKRGGQIGHKGHRRDTPRASKTVRVARRRKCYRHGISLVPSEETSERTVTDLIFTKNGMRKTVTKYIGTKGYCPKCHVSFIPNKI